MRAYKEATVAAIENAAIVEKTIDNTFAIKFEYPLLNEVMRILNQFDEAKWTQNFTETCELEISIRQTQYKELAKKLSSIYGVNVINLDNQAAE